MADIVGEEGDDVDVEHAAEKQCSLGEAFKEVVWLDNPNNPISDDDFDWNAETERVILKDEKRDAIRAKIEEYPKYKSALQDIAAKVAPAAVGGDVSVVKTRVLTGITSLQTRANTLGGVVERVAETLGVSGDRDRVEIEVKKSKSLGDAYKEVASLTNYAVLGADFDNHGVLREEKRTGVKASLEASMRCHSAYDEVLVELDIFSQAHGAAAVSAPPADGAGVADGSAPAAAASAGAGQGDVNNRKL